LNDFERAAKIAKISKIAKSTERPINTEGTKELDEFWGLVLCAAPGEFHGKNRSQ